jgi:hypothetical protein
MPTAKHTCPVCAYPKLEEAPRSKSGGGSYEICPCCGFQFGVDDDDKGLSYEEARERWIAKGMIWRSKGQKAPAKWDAAKQLATLSKKKTAKKSAKKVEKNKTDS